MKIDMSVAHLKGTMEDVAEAVVVEVVEVQARTPTESSPS